MLLDIRTLLFVQALIAFGTSLALFTAAPQIPNSFKGIGRWAIANVLQGLGEVLLFLRDDIHPFFSIVVANTLIVATGALYYQALCAFTKERYSRVVPYTIVGLTFVCLGYFTAIRDQIVARIIIVSGMLVLLTAINALVLIRRTPATGRWLYWSMAGSFGLLAIMYMTRISYVLITPQLAQNPFLPNVTYSIGASITIMATVFETFGFALLLSHRSNTELQRLATLDSLTEVYNRRAIEELLGREIARARRSQVPLSMLLLDLDRFKTINDTYGHNTGDQAIKLMVATLLQQLRPIDSMGRYGGEEFLIVLPDTAEAVAGQIAERLRRAVAEMSVAVGKGTIGLTVSIGVAGLGANDDVESLTHQADHAMYVAKMRGRNGVVVASSLAEEQGDVQALEYHH